MLAAVGCKSTGGNSGVSSSNRSSQSTIPQVVRFTIWLDILDKDIGGNSPAKAADKLLDGSARAAVFNLQGLGRLYADTDSSFDKARKRFKALEDGIGGFEKWNDLYDKAKENGSSAGAIKKLETKRDAAKAALEAMLVSEKYIPADGSKGYLETFRSFLNKFPWKTPEEDRLIMLGKLKSELETVKTTQYDFTHLEEGNGIHEFRRKMRWISMEARALNGLVIHKPLADGCPVEVWKDLATSSYASSKYGALPPSAMEKSPTAVTPCLYVRIAKAIDQLGSIKDSLEAADNINEGEASDGSLPADQAAVQAILDEMLKNDLFGKLQAELSVK